MVNWSLIMVGIYAWLWFGISAWYTSFRERYATFSWILVLGFASGIILSIKVKVLGGGFSLRFGENIAILSMEKQARLLF